MNKNVLSISHNDLDGLSVQIVLNSVFKNVKSIQCNYTNTLYILKNTKKLMHEYSRIIISDLVMDNNIKEYFLYLCNTFPNNKFYYIDHHFKSKEHLESIKGIYNNVIILFDENKSSTKLIAEYFKQESEYIEAVNAFDVWDTNSKHFDLGMKYNSLFWELKPNSFFAQFKKDTTLLPIHEKTYTNLLQDKDKYFKELEHKGLVLKNNNTVVIFGDDYQNWTQLEYHHRFNVQVFSFGKILVKINQDVDEESCKTITNDIIDNINNDLLLNSGGHYHILSLTHSGDKDYNIIIDYTKKIFNVLSKY